MSSSESILLKSIQRKRLFLLGILVGGIAFIGILSFSKSLTEGTETSTNEVTPVESNRLIFQGNHLSVWWKDPPQEVRNQSLRLGNNSNIHPSNYVGFQSCKECHPKNYDSWSAHPHRWMNALANENTVKGDFSGIESIHYRGGKITCYREGPNYFMRLERGAIKRIYQITQTIGSRFFQYYVGKQIEGPEPIRHPFYLKDHVLFFGYWLDQKEWGPIVHVGPEMPDDTRPDPFNPPESGKHYAEYAVGCNSCHTTFAMGDMLTRNPKVIGSNAPEKLHWSLESYLKENHANTLNSPAYFKDEFATRNPTLAWSAVDHGISLGVSCEACHLGSREHVESKGKIPPRFFPHSPHLWLEASKQPSDEATHANVNWACGRCHTGSRPQFAGGMSTWNSVEYSDAMRGSCYSQLRCIDCHNPHQALGIQWKKTPDQDDGSCLKCHEKFTSDDAKVQHTHHPIGSEGARCLNCHMPRINEGINDVVRTHMIYSPTRADMIEANHPNACNLCHLDKPIQWTVDHLKSWYGKTIDSKKIAEKYEPNEPVGYGWLVHHDPSVRLIAFEAFVRNQDRQSLPRILDLLDDPYLVNRQFAFKGIQQLTKLSLRDFSYRYYMSKEERKEPLGKLKQHLLEKQGQ